ncbi:MAG: hypothetical protein ABJR23_18730, partial [Paracoccaceae bacterium]
MAVATGAVKQRDEPSVVRNSTLLRENVLTTTGDQTGNVRDVSLANALSMGRKLSIDLRVGGGDRVRLICMEDKLSKSEKPHGVCGLSERTRKNLHVIFRKRISGAGGGNRTRVISLEDKSPNPRKYNCVGSLSEAITNLCRYFVGNRFLERAARIELASLAWK